MLCGFGELGASSPCQSPPSCCSAQGSCRDAEQISSHPTDSEESWFPWILSLTVYPPNPFLQQLKSSPAENQPGPKVTFILPPLKRTRLQHHEELSDPEARTLQGWNCCCRDQTLSACSAWSGLDGKGSAHAGGIMAEASVPLGTVPTETFWPHSCTVSLFLSPWKDDSTDVTKMGMTSMDVDMAFTEKQGRGKKRGFPFT